MLLREITEIFNREFPQETAMEWDNPGLLVGDENRDIKKVLVSLDVTYETVREAKNKGAQLIAAHHPVIFSPIKKLTAESAGVLLFAAENKINIFAAHTNCDVAEKGINARLAEMFNLRDTKPLEENGLGRIGNLEKETTLSEFAEEVKKILKIRGLRYCGDENMRIKRVAVGSGACSDCIQDAAKLGADVMITGDTKYHEMLDAANLGIGVIDAGHYGTEIIVTDIFAEILKETGLEVIKSESRDVYKFVGGEK